MSLQRYANAPIPSSPTTPWSVLGGAIDASTTTVTPLDSAPFPSLSQFDILVDDEIMRVTAGGSVWTVERGAEGSTAAAHADGASVYHILTAGALSRLPRSMTTAGDFEYLDASGAPARLAAPTDGSYVMSFVSGLPAWSAFVVAGLTVANFASANISQWTNDAAYATLADVAGVGYLTPANVATLTNKSGNVSQWTNDSGYVTPSSAATFTNKAGNISQWTNNTGYLTAAVTSVAMTVPSILSVSGSPITSSGTLALSLATQSANTVFAGPTSGGAATPSFRSLVAADIPSLSSVYLPLTGGTLTGTTTSPTLTVEASVTATYGYVQKLGGSNKLTIDIYGGVASGGFSLVGANLSVNGFTADYNGVGIGSQNALKWGSGSGSSTDLYLYRGGAGIFDQRNGTNAQKARWYYSYTDSSNGSWAELDTTTANTLTFGSNGNGTGAATMSKLQFNVLGVNKLDYGVSNASAWTSSNRIISGLDVIAQPAWGFVVANANPTDTRAAFAQGGIGVRNDAKIGFSSTTSASSASAFLSTIDAAFYRNTAGVIEINNGTAGTYRDLTLRNIVGQIGYHEMVEMTAPSAGAANTARIYAEDNGAGKTRLMVIFPSGAAQQIAIQP